MAHEAKKDEQKVSKKVFEPPELKVLGSLYEITKGTGPGNTDIFVGGGGGFASPS